MRNSLLLLAMLVSITLNAQTSRDYIRQEIKKHDQCKSVAITEYNGDAMIYGRNGWAAQGCPTSFTNALDELNSQREEIQDINLSENGRWLILYGNNGMRWNNLYYDLEKQLRHYNSEGEKITTVTFNDDGEWIVITTEHIVASSQSLTDWLAEGCDKYGALWTACMTNDAAVAVYESGYRFIGAVPQSLKDALTSCTSDVYMVKIAGSAWFFTCRDGYWRYNM